MTPGTGNQHFSRKRDLLTVLDSARWRVRNGMVDEARVYLEIYRAAYVICPASTRRRWKCGK